MVGGYTYKIALVLIYPQKLKIRQVDKNRIALMLDDTYMIY